MTTLDQIQQLLSRWYGAPPTKTSGYASRAIDEAARALDVRVPAMMRAFYERFGARTDAYCVQDTLRAPDAWTVEDDALVFRVENQGVTSWGVRVADLGSDDPPVVVGDHENDGAWVAQSKTFSEFALAMTLFDLKWNERATLQANGSFAHERDVRSLEARLEAAPVSPWIWPAQPSRIFTAAQGDVVVTIDGTGAHTWLWLSARDEDAKDVALELVDGLAIDWACEP